MMGSQGPLQYRLRENRYRKAAESCARVLDGLGVPEERRRVVDPREVDKIWPRYILKLRAGGDVRKTWPVEQFADVQRHVDEVREGTSGMTAVWIALVNSEPVGVEAPADQLLAAGLSYLVSAAGDLMLTTGDVADGICIERNRLPEGDEYEIVGWGVFSR
jgi:hypothetical protein